MLAGGKPALGPEASQPQQYELERAHSSYQTGLLTQLFSLKHLMVYLTLWL